MRPFQKQGFHEIDFIVWSYVDPIWRDVTRLVSRGWHNAKWMAEPHEKRSSPQRGVHGPLDIVRMRSVLIVRNEDADLYVRAGKRMRVYGPDLKCIGVDRGERTYVRERRWSRNSAFFRVDRGRAPRVVFRGR